MLAIRQQVLAFVGLEPTRWPGPTDFNCVKNDTLRPSSKPGHGFRRRQVTYSSSTCGYLDGDPDKPRTANSGYACRVDTIHALWGFCPTTVIAASDCDFAAECIDSYACTNGCGTPKDSGLLTLTCGAADHCSTAFLEAGPDQTYAYIACGPHATTQYLSAAATTPSASSTSSSSSIPTKATPSITSPSSTGTLSSTSSTTSTSATSSSITSKASPSTPAASDPSKTSTNNTGAAVGGVIGGLAFVFLAGFAIFFLRLYSKRHPKTNPEQAPIWNDGLPKIQQSVNYERAELSGNPQLPHELPGAREHLPIELDSLSEGPFTTWRSYGRQ